MASWARLGLALVLSQPFAGGLPPESLELRGKVLMPQGYRDRVALVTLFGVTTPYMQQKLVLHNNTFKFPKLEPGPYTVSVSLRGLEEVTQTIDVSRSFADRQGRMFVDLHLEGRTGVPNARRGTVSVRQLSIPAKAREFYRRAMERLARKDVAQAVLLMEKAVTEAPQFAEALNTLGTIYNQRKEFAKAEGYFREALRQSPTSYAPTVNLGGVLLAQRRLPEALDFNLRAIEVRPDDALARGQLGWVFLHLGKADEALVQFQEAKRLDPSHFTCPQLGLAAIYARRSEQARAAAELEDYLRLHPDDPDAPRIRAEAFRLRDGAK